MKKDRIYQEKCDIFRAKGMLIKRSPGRLKDLLRTGHRIKSVKQNFIMVDDYNFVLNQIDVNWEKQRFQTGAVALVKIWWKEGARYINDSDLTEEMGNIMKNEKYIYGDDKSDRINWLRILRLAKDV